MPQRSLSSPARDLGLVAFATLAALVASLVGAASQTPPSPASTPTSTSAGVYTAAQASRGEETYMNVCVACHPAGTYSAPAFREKWDGMPLSDLFDLVSSTMPKQEPGSFEPGEYAQVIAYMLKINGAPPGKTELPSDIEALKRIRISMPANGKK